MSESLFCPGQSYVTDSYRDGYFRTFKGYPEMNNHVKKMLKDYSNKKEYSKILMFFMGHCGFDEDYSGFLTREFVRGWI